VRAPAIASQTLDGSLARMSWPTHWPWAVTALVVLLIILFPAPAQIAPTDRTIRIQASSYQYAPSIVRVNQGDRVTIELTPTDVVHGLYLDGYGLSLSADPGQTRRLSFVADRPGMFRFRCSLTCGPLHPFMIGKLIVGTNWLAWRAVGLALLAASAGIGMSRR